MLRCDKKVVGSSGSSSVPGYEGILDSPKSLAHFLALDWDPLVTFPSPFSIHVMANLECQRLTIKVRDTWACLENS